MKEFMFSFLIIIVFHINFQWVDGEKRSLRAVTTKDGNYNVTNRKIQETFELLNQGEKLIELKDESRDAILVLGNSGAGKSTFTHWIAGDDTKLISEEDPKTPNGYIIHDDNNKIGNSTITSQTIFPELLVDPETHTAFYDFPGFHDTRGVANDIATTYFIKKVVDHTRSVKLLFIVNHYSVTSMGTRQDFTDLIRHATDLVKDFDKFRNSIGIIATRVRNDIDFKASKAKGKMVFFEDKSVIESMASFMNGVRQELMNDIATKTGLSEKDKTYYENAIKCIDLLLIKDGNNYPRIGIFRVPDEKGPLSNISLLQEGKKHIKTILYKNLVFTTKSFEDFGYTIPNESKNDISDIMEAIYRNIWSDLSKIITLEDNYYHDLVQQIHTKLKSFVTSNDSPVDAHPEEAETLSFKIRNGLNITTHLMKDIQNLTDPVQLAEKINDSCSSSGIVVPGAIIVNLSNQGRYLKFLKTFYDKILPMKQWASLFQSILTYLADSRKNVQDSVTDIAEKINDRIKVDIGNTAEALKNHYDGRMKMFQIQELSAELHKGRTVMLETTRKIENSATIEEFSNGIRWGVDTLGITLPKQIFFSLKNQGRYFEFLQVMSETKLNLEILTLKTLFADVLENLHESEKWYTFLDSLYEKFSSYEIQSNLRQYDVANIEDWGKEGKSQGIWITQDSFKTFIQKIEKYELTQLHEIQNFKPSDFQLSALNKVLISTLKNRINKFCPTPEKLVMTGDFVTLSNFSIMECPEKLKYIEIFAFNTFFIDTDFIHIDWEMQLSIISPTWQTVDHYKIILDGSPGTRYSESAITPNNVPGGKGADGKPGLPGGPGGNFFGIGRTFVNSERLFISANGGNGGIGQNGENGMWGVSGTKPFEPRYSIKECARAGFEVISMRPNKWCFPVNCLWGVYGTNCSDGGSGGNGGHGGYGGNPGKINIITLAPDTTLSVENRTGKAGLHGDGGKGGKPGAVGGKLEILENSYSYLGGSTFTVKSGKTFPPCKAGVPGIYGQNRENLKDPGKPQILRSSSTVDDYKKYLRENLGSSLRKSSSVNFLKQMEDTQSVKDLYDVSGFGMSWKV